MRGHAFTITAGLLLVVGAVPAGAFEESRPEEGGPPAKKIVLQNEAIQPARISIQPGERLILENHSVHGMAVAFVEPEDLQDKIGRLVDARRQTAGAPAGIPFRWDQGKLTAVIPPGRFATLPDLPPGRYTYVVTKKDAGVHEKGGEGGLPEKGEIAVE